MIHLFDKKKNNMQASRDIYKCTTYYCYCLQCIYICLHKLASATADNHERVRKK